MRAALALAGFTALVVASAPSAEGAGAARPRVALSVSPARLALTTPTSRRIRLRNDGAERVVVDVRPANTSLQIAPTHLLLRPGENRSLTVRLEPRRRAEPGDHRAIVLLATRPLRGARVNVQLRLGVRITWSVPGRVVRNLTLGDLRVRRERNGRFMTVSLANRGNVTVELGARVTGWLVRGGRQLKRLIPRTRRALPPGASTFLALRYHGPVRGRVTAVVQVRLGPGLRVVERRYRLRL